MVRKVGRVCIVALLFLLLSGCSVMEDKTEKMKDLSFTVVPETEIPSELKDEIDQKKGKVFKLTYEDGGWLYICVGYGVQKSGGYSVSVNDLYLTANAIYVKTNLIAPESQSKAIGKVSYPYVVIKTEFIDKVVVFN